MLRFADYGAIVDESWRRLERAGDDPTHPMRLIVIATVDASGWPEARLMVLRGASQRLRRLWFYTDSRSQKLDQLLGQPALTVVAWDRAHGIQLRVRGRAIVHESGPIADEHWKQTTMALRALFSSPDAPGRPLQVPDPRLMAVKRSVDAGEEAAARRNFAVIETAVDSIEWLQVLEGEQRRAIIHASTGWAVQPLAP